MCYERSTQHCCALAARGHTRQRRIGARTSGEFQQTDDDDTPGSVVAKVFDSKLFIPGSCPSWNAVDMHC